MSNNAKATFSGPSEPRPQMPDWKQSFNYLEVEDSEDAKARAKLPEAEKELQDNLAAYGERHDETMKSRYALKDIRIRLKDLAGLEAIEIEIFKIHEKELGPTNLRTLSALSDLAYTIQQTDGDNRRGNDVERMEAFVLEARRKILGNEHRDTLRSMDALARTLWRCGNMYDARDLSEEAAFTGLRTYGPDDEDVVYRYDSYLQILYDLKDFSMIETMCIRLSGLLTTNFCKCWLIFNLSKSYIGQQKWEYAEQRLQEVLLIEQNGYKIFDIQAHLIVAFFHQSKFEDAEKVLNMIKVTLDLLVQENFDRAELIMYQRALLEASLPPDLDRPAELTAIEAASS